jgi:hypothetical protein
MPFNLTAQDALTYLHPMAMLYARWIQDVAFLQGENRHIYVICRRPHIFTWTSCQGRAGQGRKMFFNWVYLLVQVCA